MDAVLLDRVQCTMKNIV